jgi:outer membrane biosynthesis protein TonB
MLAFLLLTALADTASPQQPAVATPPHLTNGRYLVSSNDYPDGALAEGAIGIVSMLVHVSAQGKPLGCAVTEASKSEDLNQRSCRLMLSRAQFEPAHDAQGAAIDGDYRTAMNWGTGDRLIISSYQVDLQVNHLPKDYRSAIETQLMFDQTGRVADCTILTSSGSTLADQTACNHARQTMVLPSKVASIGHVPAAAIRYATVRLLPKEARPLR